MVPPMTDDLLPPGLALAWGVAPTGRRGPKPAFTVEQIVATAIGVADEGGFAAVSMPKIAGRLGITANALYRYVSSKDELLVLLTDTGWGTPELAAGTGWRGAVVAWVQAFVERTRRHPWLLDLPVRGAPLTPNLLSWLGGLLDALADSGLTPADKLGCATLIDSYARSMANLARNFGGTTASPEQGAAVVAFLEPLLRERGFGFVADLLGGGYETSDLDDEDVEFGLQRILDGIDVLRVRRGC